MDKNPNDARGDKLSVVFKKRIEASTITKSFKGEEQQSKPDTSSEKEAAKIEIEESKKIQADISQVFKSAVPETSVPSKVVSFGLVSKTSEDYEAKYNKLYDQFVSQ